jgi:hypothetical protein
MRKLILISAFVSASILASVSVQAQSSMLPGGTDALESASLEGLMAKAQASRQQASKSNKSRSGRRESNEQMARQIAAKYGVNW